MSNGYMRQVYICKDSNFSHKYTFCPVILYFIWGCKLNCVKACS